MSVLPLIFKNRLTDLLFKVFTITILIIGGWYILARFNDKALKSDINQTNVDITLAPTASNTISSTIVSTLTSTITPSATIPTQQTLKTGSFVDGDSRHKGLGTAYIVRQGEEYYLIFDNNFKLGPGGVDLYVYMSSKKTYRIDTADALNLGQLKKESGTQSYRITAEQYAKYNGQIIIWCQAFSLVFSRAELN